MTTKSTMLGHYRKHSAADGYILGFVYKHLIYAVVVPEIMPRYLTVEKASRNQGENLRLRLPLRFKLQLMKKDPVCLGSDELLLSKKYNKGENFEKLVTEALGQVWVKDCVPFWEQGDVNALGLELQIKFDGATLLNTKQITKFKKMKFAC